MAYFKVMTTPLEVLALVLKVEHCPHCYIYSLLWEKHMLKLVFQLMDT